ncbi:spore germination lipoprotein GerD [Peribacillus sp. B-H-3]|uniref:spore germination lipoprotein GerD n=1 Tax=Peribacillus sp. B-H-3 TaxID=3400420 RepID=UPI003B024E65
MKFGVTLLLFSMLCLACAGCGQSGAGAEKMDYEATKKMVVDILKTDEGKKAIQDVMNDDSVKSQLIMDQKVVTDSIEKTVTSDKGKQFWEKAFKDPKFAAAYAKGLKTEHERLLKDMTKDPQYRGMIIEVMKEPELQKEFNDLLKTKEMREFSKQTLIETMDSPLVRAKIQDILLNAAAQTQKSAAASGSKGTSGDKQAQPEDNSKKQ